MQSASSRLEKSKIRQKKAMLVSWDWRPSPTITPVKWRGKRGHTLTHLSQWHMTSHVLTNEQLVRKVGGHTYFREGNNIDPIGVANLLPRRPIAYMCCHAYYQLIGFLLIIECYHVAYAEAQCFLPWRKPLLILGGQRGQTRSCWFDNIGSWPS